MREIEVVDIKKAILSENDDVAVEIREQLNNQGVFMINLMASPGAGKTSLVLKTIEALKGEYSLGVIEGDIDSLVDAEKVSALGVPTVQLHTGGACHLDAPMIEASLTKFDLAGLDCLIIENIGNLVCPAEFDTGSHLKVMISSVPEGDDKVLKYPLMFSVCDALIVNKIDYLPDPGFDLEIFSQRVRNLNPHIEILPLSCRNGQGVDDWVNWLKQRRQTAFLP